MTKPLNMLAFSLLALMLLLWGKPMVTAANSEAIDDQKTVSDSLEFLRTQMGPTGLLDSYVEDNEKTAYTYDNALVAMAFFAAGDLDSCRKVLDAFLKIPATPDGRFFESYNPIDGSPGIDHLTLGPNAYVLQAMNLYFRETKDPRYNEVSRKLVDYILSHQDRNNGGLFGQKDVTWKSTEQNLASFCGVHNYGLIHNDRDIQAKARQLQLFLKRECWIKGRFYRGENDDTAVTDAQSLGTLIMGDRFSGGLKWAENNTFCTVAMPGEEKLSGFDFNGDLDTIWTEGTLQVALAYQSIGNLRKADEHWQAAQKLKHPSGAYLVAPRSGTTGGQWILQKWQGIAPTSWAVFYAYRFNVFELFSF